MPLLDAHQAQLSIIRMFDRDIVRRATGFPFNESGCNRAENGTNIEAEMAADAFVSDHGTARSFFDLNGLMSTVVAADSATSAADAEVIVDFGDNLEIAIEVFARNDVRKRFADKIAKGRESIFFHEDGEAVFHVFDNAISVLHDTRRDLEIFSAEEEEFDRIHPSCDATDTGDGHIGEFSILFELREEAESNLLDGGTRVTGNRGFTVNNGHTRHIFDVEIADRFDCIDGRNGVSPTFDSGF